MFWIKVIVSAFVIAGASELAKRYSIIASILASLPIVSILAIIWLQIETKDSARVTEFTQGIFWAILPSLLFFLVLPLLLKSGVGFALSMIGACVTMVGGYSLYVLFIRKLGLPL